jgi:hypothetical protein
VDCLGGLHSHADENTPMIFEERIIRSVNDLLTAVESHRRRATGTPIWFRGSTNRTYSLVPSLGRRPFKLERETALTNAFKQNAIQFVDERPQREARQSTLRSLASADNLVLTRSHFFLEPLSLFLRFFWSSRSACNKSSMSQP